MKRKVNINRPKISSEEIAKHKNFDSVLKNKPNLSSGGKTLLKKPWFLSSMVVVTAAIVTTAVLMNKNSQQTAQPVANNEQQATNNDDAQFAEFYKAEEAKPCIAPPIKGLNVDYTIYKVNAEKGAELDFKTCSRLSIPKNAFVDGNGNPVKGDVELRYREFHDPIDFFVSGIPMTYDSAGIRYQFESAGMMEMLAYQNGKPVNMAPGKSVNVELASDYKGTEYNLYKLDTMHNNWSCLGKDKVKKNESNNSDQVEAKIVKVEEMPEYKQLETKKAEAKVEKETQIAALPKLTAEPKKPAQAKKEKYTFNIDVDSKEYPELAVYKGLLFEVGTESTNFTKEMYDITWDAATIKEGTKKGENYQLSLQKGTKKYDIIVYPVYEGKNYEVAMKEYQTKFDSYNTTLAKRKTEEKRIEDEYQAKIALIQKQQETMARQEKERVNREFAGMTTEEKVMRTFRINSFGVYNCDNPSAYPTGVLCNAKLTNDKGTKLMIYDVYLVDKGQNALFTYEKNPVKGFSFDPKATNMLWTVENGVIYWLKPEQFSNLTSDDGLKDLKLERVDQKFKTTDEMKAFFNL